MWLELREGQGQLKVRISTERLYTEKLSKKLARIIEKQSKGEEKLSKYSAFWRGMLDLKKVSFSGDPNFLWEDPDFPHNPSSISPGGLDSKGVAGWKRVHEISKDGQVRKRLKIIWFGL